MTSTSQISEPDIETNDHVADDVAPPRSFAGDEWARLAPGELWGFQGEHVVIKNIAGFDELLVEKVVSGQCVIAKRIELTAVAMRDPAATEKSARHTLPDEEVTRAKSIEASLSPYINGAPLQKNAREKLATQYGVDTRTVTRWVKAYRGVRHWSAFIRGKPGTKKGTVLISEEAEAIVRRAITDHMAANDDITVNAIYDRVKAHCEAINARVPASGTIAKRIQVELSNPENFPPHLREELKRKGRIIGDSIDAPSSLSVVQVDHTVVNITVNDPVTGRCIGAPWITIIFDVKTRVVLGFVLTLEAPSQLSTALALHHAVFPKDAWLTRVGATGPWPFYGVMRVLHMDNASEFKCEGFQSAARRWNIDPKYRDPGEPQHGAHIERFLGTLMGRIKLLRGTTFSRILKKKLNARKSNFTMASLETWIANEITAYHHEKHSGIGMSPAAAWERAWKSTDGLALPVYPKNEIDFLISFLPSVHRVVTREGIQWMGHCYRSEALDSHIEPLVKKRFRYDPRNISRIFFEPQDAPHFEVPWTHAIYPEMSLWEWNELRPYLKTPARKADADAVHRAREANREAIAKQATKTEGARRRQAREDAWEAAIVLGDEKARRTLTTKIASVDTNLPFEILE